MNAHIILALFALYVATITLAQVLYGYQDNLLALIRRTWGRTLGLGLYFAVHVALPVMVFVLCLGWGVSQHNEQAITQLKPLPFKLDIKATPDLYLHEPLTYPPALFLAA
jgi:hypothetical protein